MIVYSVFTYVWFWKDLDFGFFPSFPRYESSLLLAFTFGPQSGPKQTASQDVVGNIFAQRL